MPPKTSGVSSKNVNVAVRLRPLAAGAVSKVAVSGDGSVAVSTQGYNYASAVVSGSDQSAAHQAIAAPLIKKMLEGYSCALLAYGQTGSGKTHTMYGPPGCLTEASVESAGGDCPADWGLFPRTALDLLKIPGLGSMHASVVEVYQEHAFDLLSNRAPLSVGFKRADSTNGRYNGPEEYARYVALNRRVIEKAQEKAAASAGSSKAGVYRAASAPAAKEDEFQTVGEAFWELKTVQDVAKLARTVELTRTALAHQLNARSSRSHCLVTLNITQHVGPKVTKRQFLFADLAGSERIAKSGVEGEGKRQATVINGSLTVLGKVIKSIADGVQHVPWRESTLTMLLRSALGGRSCSSVVINISTEEQHTEESICSLEFGKRMSTVRSKAAVVVEEDAGQEAADLERKLAKVQAEMAMLKDKGAGGRFGADAVPCEVRGLTENRKKMEYEANQARQARSELAELQGRGGDASQKAALETKIKNHDFEAANYRDIILRQESIPGFWIPPTPRYVTLEAEEKRILTTLKMLRSSGGSPAAGSIQQQFLKKMGI